MRKEQSTRARREPGADHRTQRKNFEPRMQREQDTYQACRRDELLARFAAGNLSADEWSELLLMAFKDQAVFDALTTRQVVQELMDDRVSRALVIATQAKIARARGLMLFAMRQLPSNTRSNPGHVEAPGNEHTIGEETPKSIDVFVSYSHHDRRWLEELRVSLKPYVRDEGISVWDDTCIRSGTQWRDALRAVVQSAKVSVFLVSRHFLASDFIARNELQPLLEQAALEARQVMWIPVSASAWERQRLATFQALTDPGKPLDTLKKPQQARAFVHIAEKIHRALRCADS